MGLAISVATRCNEGILYHLDGCEREGAGRKKIVEAIKIGLMAGGSISMPNARGVGEGTPSDPEHEVVLQRGEREEYGNEENRTENPCERRYRDDSPSPGLASR